MIESILTYTSAHIYIQYMFIFIKTPYMDSTVITVLEEAKVYLAYISWSQSIVVGVRGGTQAETGRNVEECYFQVCPLSLVQLSVFLLSCF